MTETGLAVEVLFSPVEEANRAKKVLADMPA